MANKGAAVKLHELTLHVNKISQYTCHDRFYSWHLYLYDK